ncbi:MAG TPA: sugar nucleotide-binding protein, partial [Actinoplanes sp.]|nr:sugar nucleotide-binding protein [Actinoplanes sp.]
MRWLVTGAGGMLGHDLCAVLARAGEADVVAATRADLDVTDAAAVRAAVAGADVVVNAAGWTDVDGAETAEEAATAVNGHAVRALAEAAGARLIHISTDYVFDGTATDPYPEDARPAPINAYGRSKLVGERAVLATGGYVVRTAWLYGAHGPNFVRTMLRLAG